MDEYELKMDGDILIVFDSSYRNLEGVPYDEDTEVARYDLSSLKTKE